MTPFDEAVSLEPLSEGRWAGRTHPAYANMAGPFGGITAATLLNAVMLDPRRLADPIALTVNFASAIAYGEYEIATRLLRSGRTTQHWAIELLQEGQPTTFATLVCGARRSGWTHIPAEPPKLPPPASVPETGFSAFRSRWFERYRFRYVEGGPEGLPHEEDGSVVSPRTRVWIEDADERPLDLLALASLSDAFFPRVMLVRGPFRPMATVTLTTYFHIRGEDLAALGAAPVACVADAAVFHDGFADQTCSLWSEGGRLLANGVQLAWYKD